MFPSTSNSLKISYKGLEDVFMIPRIFSITLDSHWSVAEFIVVIVVLIIEEELDLEPFLFLIGGFKLVTV